MEQSGYNSLGDTSSVQKLKTHHRKFRRIGIDTRRAESRGGFIGGGDSEPLDPHQLWGLGIKHCICKLHSWVWGGAPAAIEFCAFLPKNLASVYYK